MLALSGILTGQMCDGWERGAQQNMGAAVRAAYFLGAAGVLTCARNSAPLTPAVSKASAGAVEFMPIHACASMPRTLTQAAQQGWRVIGSALSPLLLLLPSAPEADPEQHKAPLLTNYLELVLHEHRDTHMGAASSNVDVEQCTYINASLPFLKSHACAQALAMKQMGQAAAAISLTSLVYWWLAMKAEV